MIDEKRWCCRCGGQGHLANGCRMPLLPPQKPLDNPVKR